ncbi:MAG: heme lyase NrfEFG subunit NrfE, partial [Sphingomonadaceae bacterium]|nr:heme lyase NrfEFG subunit NrfE [Sphingomonadaceae bacterium]
FGLRASSISEGERFSVTSREGALVFNNVMLSAILGIVLLGTLYPLLTEAFDVRVSVGPPYFNPAGAIFTIPMLLVMAVGPLLRWRQDSFARIRLPLVLIAVIMLAALALVVILGAYSLLADLGLAIAIGLAIASFLPLRGRNLLRVPLATWGMVIAHFGIAVALFGMASESAFSEEKLAAVNIGESTQVGPWKVQLESVTPVAGPNWTALEGTLQASYDGGGPVELHPQARNFWAPPQETTESQLATRWNGQLYAVIGNEAGQGRWQLRLWWKPFVTFIWYGGLLIALGGLLSLVGRVMSDLKRRQVTRRRKLLEAEAVA